jgi:hypothetical protein
MVDGIDPCTAGSEHIVVEPGDGDGVAQRDRGAGDAAPKRIPDSSTITLFDVRAS